MNIGPTALISPTILDVLGAGELGRIVVELTEHAAVADYGVLSAALLELRAGGMRVAVDDAGAGFASLRHVLKLAPHFLKIDGSVIAALGRDRAARSLVAALVAFAQETEITVIAEGIENEHTIELLDTLGVAYGQGYALGHPAPLAEEAGVGKPLGDRAA